MGAFCPLFFCLCKMVLVGWDAVKNRNFVESNICFYLRFVKMREVGRETRKNVPPLGRGGTHFDSFLDKLKGF